MTRRRRIGSTATAALTLALAGACSGGSTPSSGPSAASTPAAAGTYTNPVYDENFPDPGVLRVPGGTYYAYGTNSGVANVQVLRSPDLVHWTPQPDALPKVGRWASAGSTWAPEVIALGGRYHLYYVAHSDATDKQCIGHAVSASPLGPFVDDSSRPLVCQADLGGSIDPDPFRDGDGRVYLLWKNDGNCCSRPVHLWASRLTADGGQLTGAAHRLIGNTQQWQGDLVEAPELVRHGDAYVLFYSAGFFGDESYAMGYATCASPLGPCTDRSDRPLVHSDEAAAGPGHCYVFTTTGGSTWMLFHAWDPDAVGSVQPGRQLWLEPVRWDGDRPVVPEPSREPQPLPR